TTVVGNGFSGFSGDGGPAASAQISSSFGGLAVDNIGNLYIGDSDNNCVRKVSPAGIIATVAGNGTAGFSGDGGPATNAQFNGPSGIAASSKGNLYVADTRNLAVRLLVP